MEKPLTLSALQGICCLWECMDAVRKGEKELDRCQYPMFSRGSYGQADAVTGRRDSLRYKSPYLRIISF